MFQFLEQATFCTNLRISCFCLQFLQVIAETSFTVSFFLYLLPIDIPFCVLSFVLYLFLNISSFLSYLVPHFLRSYASLIHMPVKIISKIKLFLQFGNTFFFSWKHLFVSIEMMNTFLDNHYVKKEQITFSP